MGWWRRRRRRQLEHVRACHVELDGATEAVHRGAANINPEGAVAFPSTIRRYELSCGDPHKKVEWT